MKKVLCITALTFSLLTGCSSIVSKSDYPVAISSSPENVSFFIVDKKGQSVDSGNTPATVMLKSSAGYFSGQTYTITFDKEGLEKQEYQLKSTVDGWYFGNILLGGLIGMLIVDPITGAMYNLPERVDIDMKSPTNASADDKLEFTTLDSLSSSQVASLEKLN